MENKKGNGIFLGVIGVATLIVAIIGATFAYFSASTSSNTDAISVESTTLDLEFEEDEANILSTTMIPSNEGVATYATINKSTNICQDDVNNSVCSIYTFTVTNPSTSTGQDITFSLKPVTNEFTNLSMKIYEGDVVSDETAAAAITYSKTDTNLISGITTDYTSKLKIAKQTITGTTEVALDGLATHLNPESSITYTMIIWINETNEVQADDAGKAFAAGITATSGNGSGVTGVIAVSQQS